jgi:hypothetical protein
MPVANKKWFKQTEELSTDLAKKLSTSSFGIGSLDTLEDGTGSLWRRSDWS